MFQSWRPEPEKVGRGGVDSEEAGQMRNWRERRGKQIAQWLRLQGRSTEKVKLLFFSETWF